MSDDALLVLESLFSTIWSLFNSWYIPGTNVTPAAFGLFIVIAGLSLRFAVQWMSGAPPMSSALGSYNAIAEWHNRGVGRTWNSPK